MITPRIEKNLDKIAHNARILKNLYSSKGIGIMCSTKVICGDQGTQIKEGGSSGFESKFAGSSDTQGTL